MTSFNPSGNSPKEAEADWPRRGFAAARGDTGSVQTLRLSADRPGDTEIAAELLRSGGLVAFPTETVYGLGADACFPAAVSRIFVAKQRPAWDPLIVHVAGLERLEGLVQTGSALRERVNQLAEAFWPGPLTLLLPRTEAIPDEVTAGRALVGVRVPSHPVAQALLRAVQKPIAAPSANRFGHVSPTTAAHVLHDLDGRIDAVLDGGPCAVGVESTVLDPTQTPMMVYRTGAVTADRLCAVAGAPVTVFSTERLGVSDPVSLPSPGIGMRHYAPEAQLVLSGPTVAELRAVVAGAGAGPGSGGLGVLLPTDWDLGSSVRVPCEPWGCWEDPESLAAGLFSGLRALESRGVGTIACPLPEPGGLREALRDRLQKAARLR